MKNSVYKIMIVFSLLIIINNVGCSQRKEQVFDASSYLKQINDSIRKTNVQINTAEYKYYTTQLGLKNIRTGSKNIEIRIWYYYGIAPQRSNVIVVKESSDNWTGELITYYRNIDSNFKKITSIDRKEIMPIIGWNVFLKKIFECNIHLLPSSQFTNHKWEGADGISYVIEFAASDFYRIYSYTQPCNLSLVSKPAHDACEIIELLDEQFNIVHLDK